MTPEAPGVSRAGGDYPRQMVLQGDPAASPAVWLDWIGSRHVPIVFPEGFYATFEPGLLIHESSGAIAARAGDDANRSTAVWPGLCVCVFGMVVVRVYRASEVAP